MIQDAVAILQDPRLAQFLSAEAYKVPEGIDHIRWEYDARMQPTNPGMRSRQPAIIRVNPNFDLAIQVRAAAHEIVHFILDGQGFPGTKSPPGWKSVGQALSGLVLNPIIGNRLRQYKLVYTPAHWKEIMTPYLEMQERLRQPVCPSPAYYHRIFRDAELLLICPDELTAQLRKWHQSRFTNIGPHAENLVKFLNEEGKDDRGSAFANLLQIRARYNLQRVGLRIVDGVTGRYF